MKKLLPLLFVLCAFLPHLALAATITTNTSTTLNSRVGQTTGSNSVKWAQKFVIPAGGGTPTTITFNVSKLGAPSDNFTLDIFASAAGIPTGSSLGTLSIAGSGIAAGPSVTAETNIAFTGTSLLAAGTYYIVQSRSGGLNDTNCYNSLGAASPNENQFFNTVWDTATPAAQFGFVLTYTPAVSTSFWQIFGSYF